MMLERYRARTRRVDDVTARRVVAMLRIRPCRGRDALFRALDRSGHDQADLVLCLLRVNTQSALRAAEVLIGHKITRLPPAYKWRPLPADLPDRPGDHRRVLRVDPEPRLKSGRRAWLRCYQQIRPGLTVAQLTARGVSAAQLRLVARRGWVVLSRD